VSTSPARDYRVHTSALAQAIADATRRQRARSVARRSGTPVVAVPRQEPTPPKEPAAPVLSPADTESIRRSARAQQQDAQETMLRAREMARVNEEMRERLRTMDLRIAEQTARRRRSHSASS